MRDRELLSQDGVVLLNLELNKNNGKFKDLEIISRGFIAQDESQDLFAELRKRVVKLTQFPANNLQKEIKSVATSYIDEETKRRPVIFVTISKE
jgi:mRNA degradation ribonuclease J1/J2